MKSVNPMMVVAVLLWVVCGAAWAGGSIEFSGGFSGGTVPNAVVLTGDNAGGTGTLRIRPSDGDSQLVLCSAANAGSPEQCSVIQHYNTSTVVSTANWFSNAYVDASNNFQRMNTSAGAGRVAVTSGTANANNSAGLLVYDTAGAAAGNAQLIGSGSATSTLTIGSAGTVTTDIRGPILNAGSATCNGILAGYECHNDDALFYSTNGTVTTMATSTTSITGHVFYNASGTQAGIVAYGNSAVADADYASKVLVRSSGDPISLNHVTDVAAGSVHTEWRDNGTGTGVVLMDVLGNGTVRPLLYGSQSNCSDGAGAAACSAAPAGSVVVDDGATTVVVSTTAVTANSQILLTYDSSLGTKLGVTCNTNIVQPTVSARTAATSFTVTLSADPATANPACISYFIVN